METTGHRSHFRRDVRAPVAIGGKADLQQRAPNMRRCFTPPRQGEPKITRGSAPATAVAPVVRPGACQFCRNDPEALSAGFVTAERQSHPSHRRARSICDLFKISGINSLPINNHHR
jgi:hypothetical protein